MSSETPTVPAWLFAVAYASLIPTFWLSSVFGLAGLAVGILAISRGRKTAGIVLMLVTLIIVLGRMYFRFA